MNNPDSHPPVDEERKLDSQPTSAMVGPQMRKIGLVVIVIIIVLAVGSLLSNTASDRTAPQPTNQSPTTSNSQDEITLGNELKFPLQVPEGYQVGLFSANVPNARDLQFSPEGLLVVSSPSTGSVYVLSDTNKDGVADEEKELLRGLNQPHGLAFYEGKLFVAEVNKVSRYSWNPQDKTASLDKTLFSLPQNGNHNKRTLLFDSQGNLYISVGSTCNVCNERDERSATVLISDSEGKTPRIYSKGLRNAPFMALKPNTDTIWVTEMGRDNLGDNLPPDEINILQDKKDYGWPYCYGNKVYDANFGQQSARFCEQTQAPIYAIPAHSAPLGLAFIPQEFSSQDAGNLLVAYHGSWNRSEPTGYKVVKLQVNGDSITTAQDFLTGFTSNGDTLGRPVDITFDSKGNAYISDDRAGSIYIISSKN